MDEFVELDDFLKRSIWIPRAATTRFRMVSEDSPLLVLDDNSRKSTIGTSQWMSIWSNNYPEIRWR